MLTSIRRAVVLQRLWRSPVTVVVTPFAVMEYPSARLEGWIESDDKVRAGACLSRVTGELPGPKSSADSCAPSIGLPCPI